MTPNKHVRSSGQVLRRIPRATHPPSQPASHPIHGLLMDPNRRHLALILRLSRATAATAAAAPRGSQGWSPSSSGPWVCASSGVSVELPLVASLPRRGPVIVAARVQRPLLDAYAQPCSAAVLSKHGHLTCQCRRNALHLRRHSL